jgi:hypothetical protein
MSVPLDRLYNFLYDICNRADLIIYGFFPHGSRKITDLKPMRNQAFEKTKKVIIFHDQEPLNFELFTNIQMFYDILQHPTRIDHDLYDVVFTKELYAKYISFMKRVINTLNLKIVVGGFMHDIPVILVHSEQRSKNVEKYHANNFIPVYWWCHALIALDWFRYAELDVLLEKKHGKKDFLVYNRAWSGTREYRLKFAEMLVDNNIDTNCLMGFNPDDQGHYSDYQFHNSAFKINRYNLEDYFFLNTHPSSSSADYVALDYQTTQIEIVLETLFDDDRIHLTEKTLRPIACGQPFILASSHGSLKYLHTYGFKTFGDLIDESYDSIIDPYKRLVAIVDEIKRISLLPAEEKTQLYAKLQQIARQNKLLFFSQTWQQQIINEYKTNMDTAIANLHQQLKEKFKFMRYEL